MTPLKTVEVQTEFLDYFTRKYDHALEMLFTTQKKERLLIHNILQELIQEQIYAKEAIQDGQSSHRNIMFFSFNEFFNTLRERKVMNFIIIFLV